MKLLPYFFLLFILPFYTKAQKIFGDGTIHFSVTIIKEPNDTLASSSIIKTVYLKGKQVRIDLISPTFTQSTLYYGAADSAVILKELGNNKYITLLNSKQWHEANAEYDSMQINWLTETKTIINYVCKKATAILKNGKTFSFFYTTDIKPSMPENPVQFKNVPGLVLEYEAPMEENPNNTIIYTATSIDFSPVPLSKFEVATAGYRLLSKK
jgi:GLPGLI family protein